MADDPELDLALLKLPSGGPHPFLTFGSSADLRLGQDLVILGYPLCWDALTVTRGILSARYIGWLQTDTAINPGNSGGPAFSLQGGVIGIATSKRGGTDRVEDINFLIEGDTARKTIGRLDHPPPIGRSSIPCSAKTNAAIGSRQSD